MLLSRRTSSGFIRTKETSLTFRKVTESFQVTFPFGTNLAYPDCHHQFGTRYGSESSETSPGDMRQFPAVEPGRQRGRDRPRTRGLSNARSLFDAARSSIGRRGPDNRPFSSRAHPGNGKLSAASGRSDAAAIQEECDDRRPETGNEIRRQAGHRPGFHHRAPGRVPKHRPGHLPGNAREPESFCRAGTFAFLRTLAVTPAQAGGRSTCRIRVFAESTVMDCMPVVAFGPWGFAGMAHLSGFAGSCGRPRRLPSRLAF